MRRCITASAATLFRSSHLEPHLLSSHTASSTQTHMHCTQHTHVRHNTHTHMMQLHDDNVWITTHSSLSAFSLCLCPCNVRYHTPTDCKQHATHNNTNHSHTRTPHALAHSVYLICTHHSLLLPLCGHQHHLHSLPTTSSNMPTTVKRNKKKTETSAYASRVSTDCCYVCVLCGMVWDG